MDLFDKCANFTSAKGAIAAGIRRIEAITAWKAEEFVDQQSTVVSDRTDWDSQRV